MSNDHHTDGTPPRRSVSGTRIIVPYFCAGLVINMFLRGELDVDPFLILVLVAGLALGIRPLPDWFYPDQSITTKRSISYAFGAIFLGCTVASISFGSQNTVAFISTMIVCPLAFYAGYVAKRLRES